MFGKKEKRKNEICTTEQLRSRPLWQRFLYPVAGVLLIILGIIGWIMPVIPGFPLILIGIPLTACVHPRLELWMRRKIRTVVEKIKRKVRRGGSLY